jgi:methionine-rich copper-binding protein CopC
MRANFLVLAALMLLMAAQQALAHGYVLAGAAAAMAVALAFAHFIRVRRFKRHDEAQKAQEFD